MNRVPRCAAYVASCAGFRPPAIIPRGEPSLPAAATLHRMTRLRHGRLRIAATQAEPIPRSASCNFLI
jgi:hypothetical protein